MDNDVHSAIALLKQGRAPDNAELLRELSVGLKPFTDFLAEQYLTEYIAKGGSKIKFVTGRPGSGKSHFSQYFLDRAASMGFITAHFSARDVWIHDFKEIYVEVMSAANIINCLKRCARKVVYELGFEPDSIPDGMTFSDYLSSIDEFNVLTKKEIRNQLQRMFLQNPMIDNNFAIACSLLTGSILGHPMLEASNRELLLSWLFGSKEVKLPTLRNLGLSPSKITKYNARHMLCSLAEVCKIAGYPGIVAAVDDMDILVRAHPLDLIRYTRLKREDAYESIRELIDEIDMLKNILFLFSFDRVLIDDESNGLKSYQALWMRIQNEIVSDRFNQFTDIIDMDRLAEQFYTKEMMLDMSRRLAEVVNRYDRDAAAIDEYKADEIFAKVRYGKVSLPRQVNSATVQPVPAVM